MKIVFILAGLFFGSIVAEEEGAVFGIAIGMLAGLLLEQRKKIRQLETSILDIQSSLKKSSTEVEPAPHTQFKDEQETKSDSETAWQQPDYQEPDSLAAELIVPGKHLESQHQQENVEDTVKAEATDAEETHVPGLFETIETRIKHFFTSGNIVVKVGMIILFFGVSFLLKYAAQKNLLPIEFRLAAVAAIGMGLLIAGWHLRASKTMYALVMQGGGIGVLYLTVFAAARLYQMIPMSFVFALMVGLVVFSCLLAVIQNARSLAIFATVGGFLAPVLTSTGQGSHVALFSYYALLNAGIVGIAWHKAWRSLNWLGFVFTFVIGSFWGARYYQPEYFSSTEPFLILFFLFFVAISILYAHRQPPELKGLVDGTLVFGTPLVGFALQSALVRDYEFGQAFSALLVGIMYLLLARTLWYKQIEGMRMLTEAFLALAIIFLSLAIPLAMDGHWTAAAWSLEGAGITWISLRQNRLSGRLFGLLLQVGAGLAFLSAIDLPHAYTPALNSAFLGSIMIGIAGLFTAYQYEIHRQRVRSVERQCHIALLIWGLCWWFGAGVTEIEQHVQHKYELNLWLLYFSVSLLALFTVARKFNWGTGTWPPLLLPLIMVVIAGIAFIDSVIRQPFQNYGYLCWTIAFAIQYYLLHQGEQCWQKKLVTTSHMLTLWLLLFILSWLCSVVFSEHVPGMHNWDLIFWGVVPAIFIMLILNYGERVAWPVMANRHACQSAGLLPVNVFLSIWLLVICFSENDPSPLGYIPILNPHDVAVLFVLFNLYNWYWQLREQNIPVIKGIDMKQLAIVIAGLAFVWINTVLAHAIHFYSDVPWRLWSLIRSELFQTSLSILWTIIALALMLYATRIEWRKLWFTGGLLLAVTIVKLFVIDLADSGTITRIISFLTVGGLMLVIGYFSPAPPKKSIDDIEHA